ncbi:GspH/FimT family pseudopilin [Marinobacter sp. F4206]|uniref:GspH/FimT family pseudopilin n=1 Tax=Marinobacter sp. F4206 TaxID=2861777 RepID=UPI001C5E0F4B|nr:GspH/FimT family pseudopilin [Marinobacter sp. F4206]MBW4936404.1 GspH/FimT family pseudopilin [Marinobacter sp. F4206]
MSGSSKNLKYSGFTLIELMVTIAVLAILVTVAVPSFRNIIISNSVSFDRDEFFSLVAFARSDAIKRGTAVTICKSSDGSTCDDSLAWSDGWLAFHDADGDGVKETGDDPVRSRGALDAQVAVSHGGAADRITYGSRGLILRGQGLVTFSHSAGSQFDRTVDIGVTGRASKG